MATRDQIKYAVSDEDWQSFRKTLKGLPTEEKLDRLKRYYNDVRHNDTAHFEQKEQYECPACIRLDNYIKALCRGGQLHPKENIYTVRVQDWRPIIRK